MEHVAPKLAQLLRLIDDLLDAGSSLELAANLAHPAAYPRG